MAKCSKEFIQKYLDNEINSKEEKHLFNEHLNKCEECRKELEFWTKVDSIKSKSKKLPVSPWLTTKIMSRLPGEISKPKTKFEQPYLLNWRKLVPVVAVLLVVLISILKLNIGQKRIYVTFKLNATEAETVSLVGDFNGWDLDASKLAKTNGLWEVTIPVKPGRYQYTLIIDGSEWVLDPQEEKDFNKNMELYFISKSEEADVAATRG